MRPSSVCIRLYHIISGFDTNEPVVDGCVSFHTKFSIVLIFKNVKAIVSRNWMDVQRMSKVIQRLQLIDIRILLLTIALETDVYFEVRNILTLRETQFRNMLNTVVQIIYRFSIDVKMSVF